VDESAERHMSVSQYTGHALRRAPGQHPPSGYLNLHSQYTSLAFGRRLQVAGRLPSMSRVANCWDNAVAERFFATLKGELIDRRSWPTRTAARQAIFEYIEVFYNRQRRHSTLGYLSPPPTKPPIVPRRPWPWRNVGKRVS
jgi:putative transposase